MPKTQRYSGYLVVDWKGNTVRFIKSLPRLNPSEVVIHLQFSIQVPDYEPFEVNIGTLEVPTAQVDLAEGQFIEPDEPA